MTPPPPPPPAVIDAGAVALPAPSASRLQQIRSRGRLRGAIAMLGPAFVACVAYVDPGNFATKIGIATGKNLPELCRLHFPRSVSAGLWVQAELIAMATDLAEFVGAAIALNLLFGVPMFRAGLM